MATRYFISLPEPDKARTGTPFGFRSHGPDGFAEELQDALRSASVFQRWLETQDDPDEVDPKLAATDPDATVEGRQDDLKIELIATTRLGGDCLRHRLRLLAGQHWQLRDVTSA
ncbi:hypothetical protein EBB59_06735 [Lysobacter pythonis]|uniref:Uncharacterized protein n=1 Tax=Solilutibacter pythonis TaxID=2483112 RepID=A0A3M2I0Q5_9GAMM|nr:hypothetical protein [Lysobacter pythonis]RMH93219.1 hypothetical protein EBB59_06735 [Lysobacter pythonis]